ncbi:MAG: LptF/LptG family permease [Ghiorsea sp.]|nr:LptF/LptG family permease [Ghiorsea sp.]
MTVLFRWIFLSTLMRITVMMFAVMLIFMVGESIDKARFIGNGLTLPLLIEYLFLKVPFMISEVMPVIVLIGTAMYVLDISKHHELAALRAAGITFLKLIQPLLLAGAVFGFLMFAVGEWIEPAVNKRLAYIERVHIGQKATLEQGVQWLHDKNTFLRLRPLTPSFFTVLMVKRDADGLWQERIEARKGWYEAGKWVLQDVYVSQPNPQGVATQHLESLSVVSSLSPKTVAAPDPRNMQWLELYHFEKTLADAGLDSKGYLFQLQRKLAAPLGCLIMILLAYSLCSSMGERMGSNAKGLVLAIVVGLLFYVVSSVVKVYVTGDDIPVIYGAWFPNILFLGISGYLLLKKEGY